MKRSWACAFTIAATIVVAAPAAAQEVDLMSMDKSQLRPEVERRYDEALAATKMPAVLSSTSSGYMWASEAKVQCAIAIGFLKSGTKDPDSLSKCERYHRFMSQVPAEQPLPPVQPPEPTPQTLASCDPVAGTLFFEWNSADLPANVDETIAFITSNRAACGWRSFSVTGHTDRSGSDAYNDRLSMRRADAVANRLGTAGIERGALSVAGRGETEPKVQTPDGERNPTNRRVEIVANK